MVEVSRALMQKLPGASQQSAAVIAGFPRVAPWFRRLFPYSKWGAELNARITPAFFGWLVGPAKVKTKKIVDFRGDEVRSVVHIERCRYLAESGCVGMCVNLCRTPVQQFFGEELGLPLRITPNFEDFSCEFEFGREAVKEGRGEDEVLKAPCLRECCCCCCFRCSEQGWWWWLWRGREWGEVSEARGVMKRERERASERERERERTSERERERERGEVKKTNESEKANKFLSDFTFSLHRAEPAAAAAAEAAASHAPSRSLSLSLSSPYADALPAAARTSASI